MECHVVAACVQGAALSFWPPFCPLPESFVSQVIAAVYTALGKTRANSAIVLFLDVLLSSSHQSPLIVGVLVVLLGVAGVASHYLVIR
jgi:hypothetical protein